MREAYLAVAGRIRHELQELAGVNVYTFNLDPQQVEILVRQLRPTMEHTSQELSAFADFLEQVAAKS